MLPELAAIVVVVAEPVHPLRLGVWTEIIGLRPAPFNSVAPSRMPPEGNDPGFGPELTGDEVLALEAEPKGVAEQPAALTLPEPILAIPPPSNTEPADIPGPLGIPPSEAPELQLGDIAGLRPPGLISVAPRPMTTLVILFGVDPLEPGMPSGEVAPIPKVFVEPCARAVPLLNNSTAIVICNGRIINLPQSFRPATVAKVRLTSRRSQRSFGNEDRARAARRH